MLANSNYLFNEFSYSMLPTLDSEWNSNVAQIFLDNGLLENNLYQLQILPGASLDPISFDDSFINNDTISQATNTGLNSTDLGIFSTSPYIGNNRSVELGSDVDFFAFDLGAGDTVTIDVDANELGSDLNPLLRLFDSNGIEVALSDNAPAPGEQTSLDSYIEFTAPSTDTYYLGVSSASNLSYDPFVQGSGNGFSWGFYDLELTLN